MTIPMATSKAALPAGVGAEVRRLSGSSASRAAIIAAAMGALTITTLFGAATMTAQTSPETSLTIWPGFAPAATALLTNMAKDGRAVDDPAGFRAVAERLYRADPANPIAVRSLAMAAEIAGGQSRATELYGHALRLSRRDLVTDLYLAQLAALALKPGRALALYDIALRTTPTALPALRTTLAGGLAEPALTREFGRLFDADAPWLVPFASWLIETRTSMVGLAGALGTAPRSRIAQDGDVQRSILVALVAERKIGAARAFHRAIFGDGAVSNAHTLSFAGRQVAPFGWSAPGGDPATDLFGANVSDAGLKYWTRGGAGLIGQKLIMRPPGSYRLTIRPMAGAIGTARIAADIVCVGDDRPMARMETGKLTMVFTVTPTCAAQWVNLYASSVSDEPADGSIGVVTVDRIAAPAAREATAP